MDGMKNKMIDNKSGVWEEERKEITENHTQPPQKHAHTTDSSRSESRRENERNNKNP